MSGQVVCKRSVEENECEEKQSVLWDIIFAQTKHATKPINGICGSKIQISYKGRVQKNCGL